MIVQAIVFYLLAGTVVGSAAMVVAAKNPVHSVLFLILAFFNSAGLFVLAGAELLAMVLVIVYVGAVAVLFLFVVMMLDIHVVKLRQGFLQYLPIGGLISFILLVELVLVFATWAVAPEAGAIAVAPVAPVAIEGGGITNAEEIGNVLYTKYVYLFQVSGLILLVAMIGAIVLTLRTRAGVRRQRVADQLDRRAEDTIEVKKVPSGGGIG
jgi:NADH-quinone oxidoreductase subunit J